MSIDYGRFNMKVKDIERDWNEFSNIIDTFDCVFNTNNLERFITTLFTTKIYTLDGIPYYVLNNKTKKYLSGYDTNSYVNEGVPHLISINTKKYNDITNELIKILKNEKSFDIKEGYKSYVIPDNVGGRFSVLTPVGLLPIACAGFDIDLLVKGAADMEKHAAEAPYAENIAEQYAAVRNLLYAGGKKIEVLANFQPKLHFMNEWWKQLYGESEGKELKGIFPAAVDFTTDLHSMGQWLQEGERTIFETVISVEQSEHELRFPHDEENLDGLNFLAGKRIDEVNRMAELGTQIAHVDGGVPNIRIVLPRLDAYYLGQLIYFFELGCGISGNVLGVNPFNQPGVEAYKKNMFALLSKPGYEAESEAIRERLKKEA